MIVSVLLHRFLDLSHYAGGSSQPMSKPCSFTQVFGLEPLLHPMDKPYRQPQKSDPQTPVSHFFFAERTRFELVIRLPVCRFSKPVDSATLPPLRMFWPNGCQTFRHCLDYKDTNFSCFPRILRKINAEVSMLMPRNPPRSDARDAGRRQDRTKDPAGSTA